MNRFGRWRRDRAMTRGYRELERMYERDPEERAIRDALMRASLECLAEQIRREEA